MDAEKLRRLIMVMSPCSADTVALRVAAGAPCTGAKAPGGASKPREDARPCIAQPIG